MAHRGTDIPLPELDAWCRVHLREGIERLLFREGDIERLLFSGGYLSMVFGIELHSGREVVVKVRSPAARLTACAQVHMALFESGYPCPEPLVALEPLGEYLAGAEVMMAGGSLFPSTGRSAVPFAVALARLVDLAPQVSAVPSLTPLPPWTGPDSRLSALWPWPEDRDIDLNDVAGPSWLDDAGWAARSRLSGSHGPLVVGHGDWYTGNIRWSGDDLYTVWDWDSTIAASEPWIAGLAAAVYPADEEGTEATVAETGAFLGAYENASGRHFSDDEREEAWAAGLWSRAFDAKKQFATDGVARALTEAEAAQRRSHAGVSQ